MKKLDPETLRRLALTEPMGAEEESRHLRAERDAAREHREQLCDRVLAVEDERDTLRALARAYLCALDDEAFAKSIGSERSARLDIARRKKEAERNLRDAVFTGDRKP